EGALPVILDAVDGMSAERQHRLQRVAESLAGAKSLPFILDRTRHRSPAVRRLAVWLLSEFRDRPREVIPVLLKALQDENTLVRRCAAEELTESDKSHYLGDEKVVLALVRALKDSDPGKLPQEPSVAELAAKGLRSWIYLKTKQEALVPTVFSS